MSLDIALSRRPEPAQEPYDPEPESPTEHEDDLIARLARNEYRRLRAREIARQTLELERGLDAEPFDAGTLTEHLARPQEPPHRIQGLLPWQSGALISAFRKTGKTTFVGNLARAVLTGEDFLGQFGVRPLDGSVGLLNYEVSGAQIARWTNDIGVPPDRLYIVNVRGRRNPLSDAADRERLANLLKARQVEMLIVDPFGRAYTGTSQNDPGEVGAWLADLDRFARGEVGALDVVLTAHTGWNQERTRGSSALEDWADSIISLTSDDTADGDGARYIRAIGRDIDLEEDRLDYDSDIRRLTLAGSGGRRHQKIAKANDQLDRTVYLVVTANPGVNGSQLGDLVRAQGVSFQGGAERTSAARLVDNGKLVVIPGKRGAKHYYAADHPQVSRPLPTSPGVTPGTSPDLSLIGERSPGTRQPPTSPGTCDQCGEPMTTTEPGQTTHPTCHPGATA